jgi:putative ABC transport system permease protein
MISDFLKFAVNNLVHRKMRSLLTIIGIFIGIAAVVSLISVGQGMQNAITEEFEKMGINKLIITPGQSSSSMPMMGMVGGLKLTKDDIKTVERVKGIELVGGMLMQTGKVKFKDETKFTFIAGIPIDETKKIIKDMQSFEIEYGRELESTDKYKLLIGYGVANADFFDKKVKLRDRIYINDKQFEVAGILKKIGSNVDDRIIVMPLETAREIFNEPDEVSLIIAQTKNGFEPDEVAEDVEKKLRKERGLKEDEEDFTVSTSEDLRGSFNIILGIINTVLIGIAGISLLVGGIGIMNTMYTSVLERTREIGTMKAIGARNSHILVLFLLESGMLGMAGGIIGVGIGIGLAKVVEIVALQSGFAMLKASLSPELILGALGFSFLIGTISGVLPARKAAKLKPVDALRYE